MLACSLPASRAQLRAWHNPPNDNPPAPPNSKNRRRVNSKARGSMNMVATDTSLGVAMRLNEIPAAGLSQSKITERQSDDLILFVLRLGNAFRKSNDFSFRGLLPKAQIFHDAMEIITELIGQFVTYSSNFISDGIIQHQWSPKVLREYK